MEGISNRPDIGKITLKLDVKNIKNKTNHLQIYLKQIILQNKNTDHELVDWLAN